ncbi:GerAB/ArcD/ProY family transporter [Fictibacillus sp. 7GRE50]|jgi:spore germination protein KB|uniref:GerAB/ArcD/ProY family transporter n=1 Tax=Fictibacillus sp. 7GRE50 TaxID=2745878 RepID=UPI0018CD9D69|nr:GerAB/ArcD/ProY family transporter [Fictibacillus sp. 7GRE50]
MERIQNKIGIREFIAIILLTIGTKMADDTPSILYEKFGNAAWMSVLEIAVIALIPVYCLLHVFDKFNGKNLTQVTTLVFGKKIGLTILFVFWVIVPQRLSSIHPSIRI